MTITHFLDDTAPRSFWDGDLPARLEIDPSDVVVFDTLQGPRPVSRDGGSDLLGRLGPELIRGPAGPATTRGGQPGDVLE